MITPIIRETPFIATELPFSGPSDKLAHQGIGRAIQVVLNHHRSDKLTNPSKYSG
jgi:hypothetical protein